MKNTLIDLNNHLFEQLERLNDDDLSDDELEKEIKRAKAMTSISSNIIDNAELVLDSERFKADYCNRDVRLPTMLESKK